MKIAVVDWETLAEFACITFLDYKSNEEITFEFSSRKNDLKEFRIFVSTLVNSVISFNGKFFDNPITNYVLTNRELNKLDGEEIAKRLYKMANAIINKEDNYDNYKPYSKYSWNISFQSIDLFLYWSMMLRKSKQLSLKFFAVNLELDVEEMPIHHSKTNLTNEEMDLVISYNKNDCYVTKALAKVLREEIQLRIGIKEEYGLDCISMDAPKIASELLLLEVAKETINSKTAQLVLSDIPEASSNEKLQYYIKFLRSIKHDKPERIEFKEILPTVEFKTAFFRKVQSDMYLAVNDFYQEYIYKNPRKKVLDKNDPLDTFVKLTYAKGGIHSVNRNQAYYKDEAKGRHIITIDIKSLYPSLYILFGYFHIDFRDILIRITKRIREQRFEAGRLGLKVKDKTLKLILNALSGLLDNKHFWGYAPKEILALRLHGQLIISRTIEELGLSEIRLLSANTDGVEVEVYDDQLDDLNRIVKLIEAEFNITFESDEYKSIRYKTVNDYIAENIEGKIKQKGEFVYKDERYKGYKVIDGSNEFNIIPIALEKYFISGISIEETIYKHENIYDFCASKKLNRSYSIFHAGKPAQQLNRYFVSKEGGYLYKQKKEKSKKVVVENQLDMFGDTRKEIVVKGNLEAVLKNTSIKILNEKTTKKAQEFPIDYQYYIAKCRETIFLFESNQTQIN